MRACRRFSAGLVVSLLLGLLAVQVPTPTVGARGNVGWQAMGAGVSGGTRHQVMDIEVAPNGEVYIGGWFLSASDAPGTNYVAKWTGSRWTALGNLRDNEYRASRLGVCSLDLDPGTAAVGDEKLYVGGDFTSLRGVNANRVARFDVATSTWSQLGSGIGEGRIDDCVEEIEFASPTSVYMAGAIDETGFRRVAKWDGTSFSNVDGGVNDRAFGLDLVDGQLYVGGLFTTASTSTTVNGLAVASLSATPPTWTAFGGSTDGEFSSDSGFIAEVAAISTAVGSTLTGDVGAGDVIVGGNFTRVNNDGTPVPDTKYLAMWDASASEWVSLGNFTGPTVDAVVEEVKVIGNYVYVGGKFDCINDKRYNNIARYNLVTDEWEAIGDGRRAGLTLVNANYSAVRAIADAGGGSIYVGGSFVDAGGDRKADGIVKWSPVVTVAGECNPVINRDRVLTFDGPKNFQLVHYGNTGKLPEYNGGETGRLVEFYWDESTEVLYDIYKVSAVANGQPLSSSYDCWSFGLSCQIVISLSDPYYNNYSLKFVVRGYTSEGVGRPSNEVGFPDPNVPATPPGPPINVVATPGWKSVTVSYDPPLDQGTYPVTNYLVQATAVGAAPSGNVCITRLTDASLLRCTFTSLKPGTLYTFKVQGLNGGGWGTRSVASNAVSPQDITITKNQRNKATFLFINRGSDATVEGLAPGYAPGTSLTAWVKFNNSGPWVPQGDVKVSAFGTFSWKKRFSRDQNKDSLSVTFTDGTNQGNIVSMGPVR